MKGFMKLAAAVALWELGWYVFIDWERKHLWKKAQHASLSRSTLGPMLIVGAPDGDYPCMSSEDGSAKGDVVLDLRDTGECPNLVVGSIESIPFPDKFFASALASHVLEHTCDPKKAIEELHRVTRGPVYIGYPRPWTLLAWLVPGHAWLMRDTGRPGPERFEFTAIREGCNIPKRLGEDLEACGA